jgi:hypothetical protein
LRGADVVAPLAGPLLYRPDAELIVAAHELATMLAADTDELGDPPPALTAAGSRLAFLAGDLDAVDRLADRALGQNSDIAARHRAAMRAGFAISTRDVTLMPCEHSAL